VTSTSAELVEMHARALAALAGLTIEDAWWPAVLRHLGVLVEQAGLVERHEGARHPTSAPKFEP
jgi:hypothetical protein